MTGSLRVLRISIRKNGKHARLPWVMRCGCGLRSQVPSWEAAARRAYSHYRFGCDEFHP